MQSEHKMKLVSEKWTIRKPKEKKRREYNVKISVRVTTKR